MLLMKKPRTLTKEYMIFLSHKCFLTIGNFQVYAEIYLYQNDTL